MSGWVHSEKQTSKMKAVPMKYISSLVNYYHYQG